jgi:hypothetical protein
MYIIKWIAIFCTDSKTNVWAHVILHHGYSYLCCCIIFRNHVVDSAVYNYSAPTAWQILLKLGMVESLNFVKLFSFCFSLVHFKGLNELWHKYVYLCCFGQFLIKLNIQHFCWVDISMCGSFIDLSSFKEPLYIRAVCTLAYVLWVLDQSNEICMIFILYDLQSVNCIPISLFEDLLYLRAQLWMPLHIFWASSQILMKLSKYIALLL